MGFQLPTYQLTGVQDFFHGNSGLYKGLGFGIPGSPKMEESTSGHEKQTIPIHDIDGFRTSLAIEPHHTSSIFKMWCFETL